MTSQTIADPYWSRTQSQSEAVNREDPVFWGDGAAVGLDNALTTELVKQFERDGFHHRTSLFTADEATSLLSEANCLAAQVKGPEHGVVIEPGSNVVRSIFRIHRNNEVFRAVANDKRLVDVARQLLGGDVYVHQSRINFKPAFDGKEFFWHSDFETWHIEDGMPRMRAVSVSVSLTDNNEFNGPLMVVPRSHLKYIRCVGATPENHHEQSLKKQEYGVPSREAMCQLVDEGGIVAPKGDPGSALFFDCNLMHGSSGNLSPYPRTNLFVVYNSVENATVAPFGNRPPRPKYLAEREVRPIPA
ncbi:MAG: ectoine hydroxylase [Planctomycetaceae bacterium]|nr:ectoine hydroxylase [Planctomycetales bacterium]MCB9923397.1 ectoine hydroxylase [Planctomycetaceae bacterium]